MFGILQLTGLVAFFAAVLLSPVTAAVMMRLGVVDRPDGRRKLHGREVPLAGGTAVWLSMVTAAGSFFVLIQPPMSESFWGWILMASATLSAVGLADDMSLLRGRHKILGQLLAVGILLNGGLSVSRVGVFGADVELGILSLPFTAFLLLGAINAMNLIDGMDGMASTVGGIIAIGLSVIAAMTGHHDEAVVAAALAGGLGGFLVFNFPPAKIFLGDTGSMMVGLVLGAIAIHGTIKSPATFAAAAPLAIWTLPILDVSMAILRRKLTGRSLYATDRGHLHHRLGDRGLGTRQSLLLVAALSGVTTAGAVASVNYQAEWIAPFSAAVVIAFLTLTRCFGHSEAALLARQAKSFAASLMPTQGGRQAAREHRSRLQGTRAWDDLWGALIAFAERRDLTELQLDVSLPALHEEYFASWSRPATASGIGPYRIDLPFGSQHGVVGSLRVVGMTGGEWSIRSVGELVSGLAAFETQIAALMAGDPILISQLPLTARDSDEQFGGRV